MAERQKLAKVEVDLADNSLTFLFAVGGSEVITLGELTQEMRDRAALHGLEQKGRDAYAGAEPAHAQGYCHKAFEAVRAGDWSLKREGVPKEEPLNVLACAIVAACKEAKLAVPTFEAAKAKLEGMDRSARAKLRAAPSVAAALARIKEASDAALEAFVA